MSSINPEDWMARYVRDQREREDKARAELQYYAPMLRLFAVTGVSAKFDGSGDEGFFEDLVVSPEPAAGLPDGTQGALIEAFHALLPGGWENNAGGFGSVSLDTATGEPTVSFEEYEEEDYDEDDDDDAAGPT